MKGEFKMGFMCAFVSIAKERRNEPGSFDRSGTYNGLERVGPSLFLLLALVTSSPQRTRTRRVEAVRAPVFDRSQGRGSVWLANGSIDRPKQRRPSVAEVEATHGGFDTVGLLLEERERCALLCELAAAGDLVYQRSLPSVDDSLPPIQGSFIALASRSNPCICLLVTDG
jgi:hypothetical protein